MVSMVSIDGIARHRQPVYQYMQRDSMFTIISASRYPRQWFHANFVKLYIYPPRKSISSITLQTHSPIPSTLPYPILLTVQSSQKPLPSTFAKRGPNKARPLHSKIHSPPCFRRNRSRNRNIQHKKYHLLHYYTTSSSSICRPPLPCVSSCDPALNPIFPESESDIATHRPIRLSGLRRDSSRGINWGV